MKGEQAELAWRVLEDLARGFLRLEPEAELGLDLAQGLSGWAIFLDRLGQVRPEPTLQAQTERILARTRAALAESPLGPSLLEGFTGVAAAFDLLARPEEDPSEAIDEALLEMLDLESWPAAWDLMHGLAGVGVYALQRLPSPTAAAILSRIVELMEAGAERSAEGLAWQTSPENLPEEMGSNFPLGRIEIGASHGAAGIIGFLGQVSSSGLPCSPQARALLEEAWAWLWRQTLPDKAQACFPCWLAPGQAPIPAHVSWCWGDAGIAAALLVAAQSAGRPDWFEQASSLALRAAEQSLRVSARDTCLCHGTAGLGHLFNRMHQTTGVERLAEIARSWFAFTLERHKPGEGVGGFLFSHGTPEQPEWKARTGLLLGSSGVGLALLAALTDQEPTWDRWLMLSR